MSNPELKLNVAIVDDHFAVRDGYRNLLHKLKYVEHVNTFDTAKEMLEEMKKKPFDLIFMDIELKNENGLYICTKIKQSYKDVKVLILSSYHSEEYIIEAYHNNADGYLFKDSDSKEVRNALDKIIFEHGKYFNTEAIDIIFNEQESKKKSEESNTTKLTKREIQIVILICEGYSNIEIAEKLFRDITTITTHRQNIMKKINAHKGIDIYNYAVKNGIIAPSAKIK